MKKKILVEFIILILWNVFMLGISNHHLAPNFVRYMAGFGTGGFIGLFYISRLNKQIKD